MSENVQCDILELKVVSINILFCLINRSDTKDIQFAIMFDTEQLQILTFEKLRPANIINKFKLVIKIVAD